MSRNKGIMALFLTCSLFLCACQQKQQEEPAISQKLIAPKEANYKTAVLEYGEYLKAGQNGAFLEFPLYENLRLEADGLRYKETCVTMGQMVKKGDVLAIFQTDDMKVEMEELRISLQRAKEKLEEGKANRKTAIAKAEEKIEDIDGPHQKNIAKINIEKQWIDYEKFIYDSQQEIEDIEEQIADLQEKLADCTITAPFDGMIDDVTIFREGEIVNAGELVVSIFSLDKVLIRMDEAANNPSYNAPVRMEAGTKKNKITASGRVISSPNILPHTVKQNYSLITIEDELNMYDIYQKFNNNLTQRIMCYYNLEELQNILLVDKFAVETEGTKKYVYILENGTVQKRYVVTGLTGTDKVWILDGVSEGQTIILN